MVHSETVYCKDCNKELAHWDMFLNLQYEEEWECNGKYRETLKEGEAWRSKSGRDVLWAREPDKEHPYPKRRDWTYCCIRFKTKYCRKCAEKRHFKCGRPRCKGRLVRVRNKDGSSTKHTHGGY